MRTRADDPVAAGPLPARARRFARAPQGERDRLAADLQARGLRVIARGPSRPRPVHRLHPPAPAEFPASSGSPSTAPIQLQRHETRTSVMSGYLAAPCVAPSVTDRSLFAGRAVTKQTSPAPDC